MNKKVNAKRFLLLYSVVFLFTTIHGFSQQLNYTLNRDFSWGYEKYFNSKTENLQTFVKPYRYSDLKKHSDSIAIVSSIFRTKKDTIKKRGSISINPILNLGIGYQLGSPTRFVNNADVGVNFTANIGEKFSFNLQGTGGRASYNAYTDSIIKESAVVPGIGYAYNANDDSVNRQYAYQYFTGYLSYSPNKIFNFQIGQDKHFWGDGYRSLFLSDAAAPYPFLKITTNIWKLTYVNLFTAMKDATHSSGFKSDWTNKYATFHYLGWNATKRIQVGLFESIVWQGTDSTRYRGYDVNYLNPILFYRPTEYSLGSSDNALIGFNLKIKLFKNQQVYGQLLLDEFLLKEIRERSGWWANKYAFQLGFKSFDVFKIKNLNFQTEFNYVRPYTYAHGSVQQNYAHMNQPLAHPLGANFVESVGFLNYRIKRIFLEAKGVYTVYGDDNTGTNYGKNIFISYVNRPKEYGNYTTQGVKTDLLIASLRVAYLLVPSMNLKVEAGFLNRMEKNRIATNQTPYIFIGIRSGLGNLYDDF